jgi:predicted ATPase
VTGKKKSKHLLQAISIEGYKSIKQMRLELRPINVLIGANGAGKSNFCSALEMIQYFVDGRLQYFVGKAGGAEKLLHFGSKVTQSLVIDLDMMPSHHYHVEFRVNDNDRLIFANETWSQDGNIIARGKEGSEESIFSGKYTFPMMFAPWALPLLFVKTVYHFHDTGASSPIKSTPDLHDNMYFRPDGKNLAAYLYLLKEKHDFQYRSILRTVQQVAPFIEDFILRPTPLNENVIRLEWKHKKSDDFFDVSSLSDGTLRFICLATLLLQPNPPPIIVIDEPELGLHPYALSLFASLVRSASVDSQVIIATQSARLVDHFKPEDIVVVDRVDEASTFRRLTREELTHWLDDYSLGEVWEKNLFDGIP